MHLRLTSLHDSMNRTVKYLLQVGHRICYKRCIGTPCELTFTRSSASVSKISDVALALWSMTASNPDVRVTTVERISFIDFFTFVCSCFGTWFGVSFLSLDPFGRKGRTTVVYVDADKSADKTGFDRARKLTQAWCKRHA